MERRDEEPGLFARMSGVLLTLGMIALTELVTHLTHEDENISVLVFLLTLVPIAYAGLKGGLPMGAASALLLAAYTLHYTAPHEEGLISTGRESVTGFVIVAALGLTMAWSMSRIKAREDRFREALEARAHDLETRNRELVEANAALEAFGYVVSHDLKEPVRALENYLDVAREEWPSDESRAFLEKAYAANERLARMLHGLLDYSRTSSLEVRPTPLDADGVLYSEACASQWQRLLRERRGELRIEAPLPRVMGDEVVVAQLLGNLVLNALRHNPHEAPRVVLRALPPEDGLAHLVLADNGPGFPPDVIERFGQLRENRPASIKAGFGLVIAHRAAQRLGGRMHLANGPAGGGEVHLFLPEAPEGRSGGRALLRESDNSPDAPLHQA